ncbi:hypothetical protein EBU91_00420 [bacterium]|nr:hypothetical protein [bacterium]
MNNLIEEKIGVVFFHKNIEEIYSQKWIEKCINSILSQTLQNFEIYELNYGGKDFSILKKFNPSQMLNFFSTDLLNHGEALNFILDKAFEDGCSRVFLTNMDDYYDLRRFEIQNNFLDSGYDLVSSDFCYIQEIEGTDQIVHQVGVKKHGSDLLKLLEKGLNPIAHPCVAMNKIFWQHNRYIPYEIPKEDMNLWIRGLKSGYKFWICDEILLFYRLHEHQVTGNNLQVQTKVTPNPIEDKANRGRSSKFVDPTLL